ncbi:MAG: hypothetical protein NVS4B8_27150 [Herpetosiphon sp.]
MLCAELLVGGSVLDVGAGTGRNALPLASIATTVTAVEPSASMRSSLAAEGERRGKAGGRFNPGYHAQPHSFLPWMSPVVSAVRSVLNMS